MTASEENDTTALAKPSENVPQGVETFNAYIYRQQEVLLLNFKSFSIIMINSILQEIKGDDIDLEESDEIFIGQDLYIEICAERRGEMDIGFEAELEEHFSEKHLIEVFDVHPPNHVDKTRSGRLVKKPKHHYHFVNI